MGRVLILKVPSVFGVEMLNSFMVSLLAAVGGPR